MLLFEKDKNICKKRLTKPSLSDKIHHVPNGTYALVAQLDRVTDYESVGRGFESLPSHQVKSHDWPLKMRCKSWDFLFYNDPETAGMCLVCALRLKKCLAVCLMSVVRPSGPCCWTSEHEFIKITIFILKIFEKLQKIRVELPWRVNLFPLS